ncbi:MAG: hypothetical protein FIB08_00900 [Candidatus Methanoperedens sp.]|nr:hypothetical protein [Candidatus Methanoperedens sp.]
MFEHTSRYYDLENAAFIAADGRKMTYKRRRFLPHGENMPLLAEVIPIQGDRLDLIAFRTLGDPQQFWRICDANNAMKPEDLIEPGRIIRVAVPHI